MRIAILLLLLVISSCDDDDKFCFECTTKTTTSIPGTGSETTTSVVNHCDKTNEEAKDIQKSGTGSINSGGVRVNYQTNCVRK
jgi:hypothetical protein